MAIKKTSLAKRKFGGREEVQNAHRRFYDLQTALGLVLKLKGGCHHTSRRENGGEEDQKD